MNTHNQMQWKQTLQSEKGFCCFFQFTQSLMHSLTEDFAHLPPSHQDAWQDLHKSHHTWITQCSHNVCCDHPMIPVHIQLCWMCTVFMTLCLWFKKNILVPAANIHSCWENIEKVVILGYKAWHDLTQIKERRRKKNNGNRKLWVKAKAEGDISQDWQFTLPL